MDPGSVFFIVLVVAIIGGISIAITGIISNAKLRELKIRERIAMIEKGLVPPPEVDPAGFDRAMDRVERRGGQGRGKLRRAGVTLIGVGFGLMFLIAFTGSTRIGIGLGGFLISIGSAFLINSLFESSDRHLPVPPAAPTTPPG